MKCIASRELNWKVRNRNILWGGRWRKGADRLNHVWITGYKSFFISISHSWSCLVYRTCWILSIFFPFSYVLRLLSVLLSKNTFQTTIEAKKGKQNIFHGIYKLKHSFMYFRAHTKSHLVTFLSSNLLLLHHIPLLHRDAHEIFHYSLSLVKISHRFSRENSSTIIWVEILQFLLLKSFTLMNLKIIPIMTTEWPRFPIEWTIQQIVIWEFAGQCMCSLLSVNM